MTSPPNAAVCGWCRSELRATPGIRFCGRKCRQAAFRLRRRASRDVVADRPMRFAYADPPYPGTARRYYGDQPTYAGEVDHGPLVASLVDAGYDGWALSTSAKALCDVLKLCPPGARVAAWAKPHPPSPQTLGMHNCWEPVIVVGGRRRRPGVSDVLIALPARGGGELPGRKPIAFCAWLFRLLGMQPGDTLADLFPGTGIVGRAWGELSRAAADDGCRRAPAHDDTCSSPDLAPSSLPARPRRRPSCLPAPPELAPLEPRASSAPGGDTSSPAVGDAGERQPSPVLEERHPASREVLGDVARLQGRHREIGLFGPPESKTTQ